MAAFEYRDEQLFVEGLALDELARRFGTPAYVYSRAAIEAQWRAFDEGLGSISHLVCYAVKANSNLAVLNLLARLGSGFDIVSGGELERVLCAGGDPGKIVFSGVGKSEQELCRALEVGILCFNIESEAELERLNHLAGEMSCRAPVSLRVNPDVDPKTHPYIATGLKEHKFGIAMEDAVDLYRRAHDMSHITVQGIDCHIGSQLTELEPFAEATRKVLELADELLASGLELTHLNLGGGLGIRFRDENPATPAVYTGLLCELVRERPFKLLIEPGRAIVGNAGLLLSRVEYIKHSGSKHFAVVDAAMNDLMRPALYQAWHDIVPVHKCTDIDSETYNVVGPVCESGDVLGAERELRVTAGDLLAVHSAGAYGFSMSSSYNSRPRAVELMVDGNEVYVVRERERVEQLHAGEFLLPD